MSFSAPPPAVPQPTGRRFALFTTELGVGGAERCLTQLALGLARRGHAPTVLSLAPPPPPPRDALVRQLESAGIPTQFIGVTRIGQLPRAQRELTSLLREIQPQLLQTFLFHANVVGAWAARRAAVPHHVAGLRVAEPSWWRHRVERWALRSADRIVCVSQSVADFARGAVKHPADKLVVIPNGIDLAEVDQVAPLDRIDLPFANHKLLVAIGRLHPQKGFDWLLDVLPRVFAELPEHRVLIVGDGPERATLEAQSERRNLTDRVAFTGWRADVRAILRAADGFLLPSRWEGMPNALIEAMAARLPVVAARVEGVTEVLGDLAVDQCYSPGDESDFLQKLSRWATSESIAKTLGESNHRRIAQHFSLDSMLEAYERLYLALLSNPS